MLRPLVRDNFVTIANKNTGQKRRAGCLFRVVRALLPAQRDLEVYVAPGPDFHPDRVMKTKVKFALRDRVGGLFQLSVARLLTLPR
jgi:hypothetical protein